MQIVRTVNIRKRRLLVSMGFVVFVAGCGNGSGPVPVSQSTSNTLNDTGRVTCSDDARASTVCPVAGAPDQDAEVGRDAQARAGKLLKIGSGDAGFDFSKLGSDGMPLLAQNRAWNPLGAEADGNFWPCVSDNQTGLTWEIKHPDQSHPRYALSTYSWYSDDNTVNGGVAGMADLGECNTGQCDSQGYVAYVNSIGLCGFRDWRLPSVFELFSIGHQGREDPALEMSYFPDTLGALRYWTGETSSTFAQNAWYLYFSDASVSYTSKNNKSYVRLVRLDAAKLSRPMRYQVLSADSIKDTDTGLIWARCPIGQAWSATAVSCAIVPQAVNLFTWSEALVAAASVGGGWRLPNSKELESLVKRSANNPAIETSFFSSIELDFFWTSTPASAYFGNAWAIQFRDGGVVSVGKEGAYSVRLVKDSR